VGAADVTEAQSITHNAGPGGYKFKSGGAFNSTVLGKTERTYAQQRKTTLALNDTKLMLAGIDSTTVLVGSITRTVAAGAGIADTVTAGNHITTVVTGNHVTSVATGNMTASIGAGNMAFTVGAGNMSFLSGITSSLIAGVTANVAAPIVRLGFSSV